MIRRLLGVILVNVVLASIPALGYLWFTDRRDWGYALVWWCYSMAYSNVIGLAAAFVMPRLAPRLVRLPFVARWASIFASLAALAVVGSLVATWILMVARLVDRDAFWQVNMASTKIAVLITLAFGIGSVVLARYRERMEQTSLELRTRELERERALKIASEARLQTLSARIHPHFLFNALNSVSALIREEPDKAERQVERIARFLRFSIDRTADPLVPLDEEMRIVTDYLEIERTRFGERIRYSTGVGPEAGSISVPPMSVQTLVENSVKYAVATRREGGEISVNAEIVGRRLHVTVWDNGAGFDPDARPSGHGLDLLTQRLQAIYGSGAHLLFTNGAGMAVTLVVPCEPS